MKLGFELGFELGVKRGRAPVLLALGSGGAGHLLMGRVRVRVRPRL